MRPGPNNIASGEGTSAAEKDIHKLIKSVTPILQSVAYNLTKNTTDAEDLYQDTVFKILSNQDKFTAGTNFKAWAITIMKNLFINGYRKGKKKIAYIEHQIAGNLNEPGALSYVEGDINIEQIHIYISELDDTLRIPFEMHVLDGKKYQEIADGLNVPLGTIKSRIFFARRELKKRIQREMAYDVYDESQ